MKRAKKSKKLIPVRASMGRTVAGVVLALWAISMVLLTWGTGKDIVSGAAEKISNSFSGVNAARDDYKLSQHLDSAALTIRYDLSIWAMELNSYDGGYVLRCYDVKTDETIAVSQLAFGYGYTEGRNQGERWYLEFDSGLDDEGQLTFARRLMERYQEESPHSFLTAPSDPYTPGDGTVAQVTGIEEPGGGLRVQRLVLVHPDGTRELFVETAAQGDDPITVELSYVVLDSALLPGFSSYQGYREYDHTNLKRHLENYRSAQELALNLDYDDSRSFSGGEQGGNGGWRYGSDDGYAVAYGWAYQSRPVVMYRLRWVYGITFLMAAVLIWVLAGLLTEETTVPVERLCTQIKEGKPCEPDSRLKEVNTLACAFNESRDKLADDLRRQRDLTWAVAHEFKTPAAVLRAYAEALGEDAVPEKRREYLDAIVEEADHMGTLVNELLDLSRLEGSAGALTKAPVDLTALVRGCFERLRLPMEERGLELILDLEPVTVGGDPRRLEQAVNNLAVNALRHADPGPVAVKLTREDSGAALTVENRCPAVPPEQLERLWEPFYKGDASRSGEGSGLGLAVVRNIVALHGGRCTAQAVPGGLLFRIELP